MMEEKLHRIKNIAVLGIIILLLTACASNNVVTWQEQYDLGVQYLMDGNYEAAIVAFTEAIEIEPKRAEAYISLADAYIAQDDYEMAEAVLHQGLEATDNDQDIADKLTMLLDDNSEIMTSEESENNQENDFLYVTKDFIYRSNYRDFEDFSEGEQQLIENMAAAAISGEVDTDKLRELIEDNAGISRTYSFWGEYKISIYVSELTSNTSYSTYDPSYVSSSITANIILRPESETGYYLRIQFIDGQSDSYTASSYILTFITCPCEDWQWNGDFLEEKYDYSSQTFFDERGTVDKVGSTITTGNVDNNLFNGTFNSITHRTETWSILTDLNEDITTSSYSIYQEGRMVETDGQTKSSESIYGVGGVYSSSLSPELYW